MLIEPLQLILIGLSGVGKSTVGRLLASRTGCPFRSLDAVEDRYICPAGYDVAHAERLGKTSVPFAKYNYRRQFFSFAVDGFLRDNTQGILELGAGHCVVPGPQEQVAICKRLAPYPNVVLLLPTGDLHESIRIIRTRLQMPDHIQDINELFVSDDTYFRLAKHVVYTREKSPQQILGDVASAIGLSAPQMPCQSAQRAASADAKTRR